MVLGGGTAGLLLQGFRLYAGYRCFKDIEGAEESRMRQWCIFWVLVAAFTAAEPLADALLFWVPLYHSAKFCFACYLLANGMAGAQLVYARYARALIARHEPAVDSALASARSSAAGLATTYAAAAGRWAQVAVLQALASGQAAAAAGLRAEPAGTAAPAAAGGGSFRSARSSRSTECGEAFASAAPAGGFRSYLPDGLKGE